MDILSALAIFIGGMATALVFDHIIRENSEEKKRIREEKDAQETRVEAAIRRSGMVLIRGGKHHDR